MAIKFVNIRSGETRVVDTEPMLAAFYNSSNMGPNSHEGQDFGWRLAPETIARMREIRRDQRLLDHIKSTYLLADEVKDTDILRYVSEEEARKQSESSEGNEALHARKYEDDVRAIEDQERVEEPEPEKKPQRKPTRKVSRDAGDGQFVSEEDAKANPDTTVTETVENSDKTNSAK